MFPQEEPDREVALEQIFRGQEDEELSDIGISREIVRKEIDFRKLNLRGLTIFCRGF